MPIPSAKNKAPAQSWKAWARLVAFIIVAFAGGRYLAGHLAGSGTGTSGKSDASRHVPAKKSGPPSASEIAEAKTNLAEVLSTPGRLASIQALDDYVATLDKDMVKALLNDLNKQGAIPALYRYRVLPELMNRWAELDPQAAISWLLNSAEPSMKEYCTEDLFDALSARDPAAALAAWPQFRGQPGAVFGIYRIFESYAQQNPQAALAALQALPPGLLPPGTESSNVYSSIFTAWAEQNPAAAAAAVANMAPSAARNDSLDAIIRTWTPQDPTAALAWAQTFPPGKLKDAVVDTVIQVASQNDPADAANYAMQLPSGANQDILLNGIINNWAQADPTQLLNWAGQNLTGAQYDTATLAALRVESTTNPAAAAALVTQNNDANITNQTILSIAQNWTQQDPQAALSWAVSLPVDNTTTRDTAIKDVLSAWIGSDPSAMAAYLVQNFATDPSFTTLATSTAATWEKSDPQSALTWVNSLPPGEAQNSATLAAIGSYASANPQAAWNVASQLPGATRTQAELNVITTWASADPQSAWNVASQLSDATGTQAELNIITAWARKNPAQAAQAIANIPAGPELDTATSTVAGSWLISDPNSALQWVNTLPQGSAKDAAINQIITIVGKNDPGTAYNWAVTMSDPAVRNDQAVSLATHWSNQNPAAAATAAQNALGNLSGLTPDQQAALQSIAAKASAP